MIFCRILRTGEIDRERLYVACSADNQVHSINARVVIQLGRLLPCKRTTTLWLYGRWPNGGTALGWLRGVMAAIGQHCASTVYGL